MRTTSIVSETLRVAQNGEGRADNLDLTAWLMIILGAVIAIAAASIIIVSGGEDSDFGRTAAALGASGAVIGLLISGALLFGFASLVRNSSRSLTIDVLDSSMND